MQQMSLALFLSILFLINSSSFAKKNDLFAGYRVIRATPQDFISALIQPGNAVQKASDVRDSNRLSRYFNIKNKTVRQDYILFQIYPDFPLLKQYYEKLEFVEFEIRKKNYIDNEMNLDIKMYSAKKEVLSGRIEVTRHELGSLLKFYITDSSYSSVIINLFVSTFKLAKITFTDETAAAKQTLKEAP